MRDPPACPRPHPPPRIVIASVLMQPYLFLCSQLSRRAERGGKVEGRGLQLVIMGLGPAGRRQRRRSTFNYLSECGSAMRLPAWDRCLLACIETTCGQRPARVGESLPAPVSALAGPGRQRRRGGRGGKRDIYLRRRGSRRWWRHAVRMGAAILSDR